ncbi:hypothetical protein XELAEV_18035550mg [Xenopus laevis]|uniref:CCHC-type domain-containing protein n=1 Tax=Xenopus laevis TaxID=8355 RepID=A0A974CH77_XENLA|nr:hypothetical protein XELAEV_18035550mg [Xenopus laevis]
MVPKVKEEFLNGEQMFYLPRVAVSCRDSARVLMNVLIDSPREIDCDRIPPDIDAESEGPWKIVLPDMSDDADELTTQGEALTTQYAVKAPELVPLNKTLFESPAEKSQVTRYPSCESVVSKGSRHSSGGRLDTPEIVSALGQLTDQLTQLAWNGNFKRLKVFSGTDPVPTGKESFESWRDSTVVSVRDWTGPKTTMIRKILESLRSPAMDVVKSYMVGHPDATSGELEELKAQLSERATPPAEAKKVPKCYQCGKLGHIQPNCPVPDEGDEVCHKRRRFYGRCYKCQVMGHQAQSYKKTYKNSTVQKSYYEPSICESDSPEEDKVAPETSETPDRSKGLGLGPIGWAPQCILGREGVPYFGAKYKGSPRELNGVSTSSCKIVTAAYNSSLITSEINLVSEPLKGVYWHGYKLGAPKRRQVWCFYLLRGSCC